MCVYIHTQWNITHNILIKKKSCISTTWMDLEGIMLTEISQAEKDKYRIISLT